MHEVDRRLDLDPGTRAEMHDVCCRPFERDAVRQPAEVGEGGRHGAVYEDDSVRAVPADEFIYGFDLDLTAQGGTSVDEPGLDLVQGCVPPCFVALRRKAVGFHPPP